MNRSSCVRFVSLLSAVLASAVLVVGSSGKALAADPSRPNIVLIISDDLGWNYYGFMDHPVVKTPNLDRLANEGVLFDVGHLTASKCKPSVAGILTGRYCRDLEIAGRVVSPALPTIPGLLSQNGYATLLAGKFTKVKEPYEAYGFTETDGYGGGRGRFKIVKDMSPVFDFIKRKSAAHKPFFVWFMPRVPHAPYGRAPQEFKEQYAGLGPRREQKYFAMISWFDDMVQQVVESLEENSTPENPVLENTLIIILTDNGGFLKNGKGKFSENGYRTPVIVSYPRGVENARRFVRKQVHAIDLFPTIMDYAGIDMPDDSALQGVSFRSLIEADPSTNEESLPWRKYLFGHKCTRFGRGGQIRYLRTEDGLKYVVNGSGEASVRDVTDDPAERTRSNLTVDQVQIQDWRRALDDWWFRR